MIPAANQDQSDLPADTPSALAPVAAEVPCATAREATDAAREPGRAREPRHAREPLSSYATPNGWLASLCLATSVVPYLLLSGAIYVLLPVSDLFALALALPAAVFLVRTFIVFHDCSHGAFLRSRRANAWLGTSLGLLLYSPFLRWRHDHAVHHATSGDLARRGTGDVRTLTVAEYRALPWKGRLAYRLVRNPLVMFGLGPVVAMIVGPRIVARDARPRMRRSVILTNVALALIVGSLCWLIGWRDYLLVAGPPALLAGSIGIWLFYVQHQFEDAYWETGADWSYAEAALRGSSFLELPAVLRFCTGNIGYHHVHHLNARIPNYNLRRAHEENPIFWEVPTLSLHDGLRAVTLKLWDEEQRRLVTFAEAAAKSRRAPTGAQAA
jgi:acyl-lipid omega-6 desaturase (Delta-12 desaturase)